MYKIAIIEDNETILEVLTDFMNSQTDIEVLIAASSYEMYVDYVQLHKCEKDLDFIICDIGLPGKSGIEAVLKIKSRYPDIHIMMFTVFEDQDKIFQALCAGATGYILKTTPLEKIKEGMFEMLDGGAYISPKMAVKVTEFFSSMVSHKPAKSTKYQEKNVLSSRELEILSLLQSGESNKSISEKLYISVNTVKYHIKNIYSKLHITCRKEIYAQYSMHQFK